MKMKKMVGALALTAALAMGTAPAFAAPNADNTADEFSDSGSTAIKAQVDTVNKQVRASVPLQVTVVFGANGGGDITGPNASAYKISNIGEGAILVSDAEITDMNSYFKSMAIMQDGKDYLDANEDPITENAIMLTYDTGANKTYLTTDHSLKAAKSADSSYVTGAKRFTAEEIAVGEDLGINLGGKFYFPSAISMDGKSDTLCKIKYTIEAA